MNNNPPYEKVHLFVTVLIITVIVISLILYLPEVDDREDESDWKSYPYVIPNTNMRFPDVEGEVTAPLEEKWISIGMELEFLDSELDDLFIVLLYHPGFKRVYLFGHNEPMYVPTSRGEMTLAQGKMDMVFENDDFETDDIFVVKEDKAFAYDLRAVLPMDSEDKYVLDVTLESTKPPATMYDGKVEFYQYYYYLFALTNCEVQGEIILNGRREDIRGTGWIEHQWGVFASSLEWDWFAFWGEEGAEVEIVDLYVDNDKMSYMMYVGPEGETKTIDDLTIDVISTERGFGSMWEITSSENEIRLNITLLEENTVYPPGTLIGFGRVKGEVLGTEIDTFTYIECTKRDYYIPPP